VSSQGAPRHARAPHAERVMERTSLNAGQSRADAERQACTVQADTRARRHTCTHPIDNTTESEVPEVFDNTLA